MADERYEWQVVAVIDPDRGEADLAYTVGLHDHGLPELFLAARPSAGDDVVLAPAELGDALNDLGRRLVDGAIASGSVVALADLAGRPGLTVTVGAARPAHGGDVPARQAHPEAQVCPITWSAPVVPASPRRPLDLAEIHRARSRLASLVGRDEADAATFAADAPFGPNTAVVEALRARTLDLDRNRTCHLLSGVHLGWRPDDDVALVLARAGAVGLAEPAADAVDLALADACRLASAAFADEDTDLEDPATGLFAALLAVAYAGEVAHHAFGGEGPPGSSEVLWALLDPESTRSRRFIQAMVEADPSLAALVHRGEVHALAEVVADVDDDDLGGLVGRWPIAAAAGHGSGLWLASRLIDTLTPAGFDVAWSAAAALATAGYHALGVQPREELDDGLSPLAHRVTDDVRALARRRAA